MGTTRTDLVSRNGARNAKWPSRIAASESKQHMTTARSSSISGHALIKNVARRLDTTAKNMIPRRMVVVAVAVIWCRQTQWPEYSSLVAGGTPEDGAIYKFWTTASHSTRTQSRMKASKVSLAITILSSHFRLTYYTATGSSDINFRTRRC